MVADINVGNDPIHAGSMRVEIGLGERPRDIFTDLLGSSLLDLGTCLRAIDRRDEWSTGTTTIG